MNRRAAKRGPFYFRKDFMDVFNPIYRLMNKQAYQLILEAGLVLDKDSKIFFVDSVHGSDSYGGRTIYRPFATIGAAYSACTTNNHDVILVLPRHAETRTSVLTIAKVGLSIIGMKSGNKRPILTMNAAADAISIEAADVLIQGIKFAAPLTDAQTADINVAAADCCVRDCVFLGSVSTENKVNVITITADGDDFLMEDCMIYNTAVEVPGAILLEGAATNVTIKNVVVLDSVGFTNGALYDAAAATGVYLEHCIFQNRKAATAVVAFSNNSVGVGNDIGFSGRHTTIASNVTPGTSFDFFFTGVTEEAAKTGMIWTVDAD